MAAAVGIASEFASVGTSGVVVGRRNGSGTPISGGSVEGEPTA